MPQKDSLCKQSWILSSELLYKKLKYTESKSFDDDEAIFCWFAVSRDKMADSNKV